MRLLALFVVLACLSGCGLRFQTLSLGGDAPAADPPDPNAFERFDSKTIFEESSVDAWGLEKNSCKDFLLTEEAAFSGSKSLHLRWDKRGGCPWTGFGIGWDGWRGKEIGLVSDVGAIQFKLRTAKGQLDHLRVILQLEDYSSAQAGVPMQDRFLERTPIDERWQTVTIPLSLFPLEDAGVDPYNIKQLLIEVNDHGNIYIDDIRIVKMDKPMEAVQPGDDFADLPVDAIFGFRAPSIYQNATGHTWGLESDKCKQFRTNEADYHAGGCSIELRWDKSKGCDWIGMGFGWDDWKAKDLHAMRDKAGIEMYIKSVSDRSIYELPIIALLEDYNGKMAAGTFSPKYFGLFPIRGEWTRIRVPLWSFNYDTSPIDLSNVKQLVLELQGAGHLLVDDIRIVAMEKEKEMKVVKQITSLKTMEPALLFGDAFSNNHGWGIAKTDCRDFKIQGTNPALHLEWESSTTFPCDKIEMGISWNKWEPVDMNSGQKNWVLELDAAGQAAQLQVGFQDFGGKAALLNLDERHTMEGGAHGMLRHVIPLTEILETNHDIDRSNIKQFLIRCQGSGAAQVDNIKIRRK